MALNIVQQIKDTILGVKSNKIDSIIDDSFNKMDRYSSVEDQNKYLETMKKLISQTGVDGNGLLKSLSTGSPQVQQYDNSGRINRYNEYDAICAKIPYCERALQCWVDHIVSPDEILKTSLQITPIDKKTQEDDVSRAIGRIEKLCKHFNLEFKIRDIVKTTLKKGDNFIEFVKTPNGANTLVVLNEGFDPSGYDKLNTILDERYSITTEQYDNKSKVSTKKQIRIIVDEAMSSYSLGGIFSSMGTNLTSPTYPTANATLSTDVSGIVSGMKSKSHSDIIDSNHVTDDKFGSKFDKKDKEEENENKDTVDLSDLSMVIHDPKYVIKLETKRFKVCLGYLVFPKVDLINVQSGVVNNIDAMCAQLLTDVKQKLSSKFKNDDKINITDDIKKVILTHLNSIDKNEDLKIRYVNPDFMQHFKLTSMKYDPYGESIFDPVLFNCRMYMAQKTAAVVKQINACTDKRFISLEIGLPRDAKNVIEQMKEQLNKKRVTVDNLGNTDTIPSQISTWENIFIPMKEGKKYVEIDHQQWSPNSNEDTEALKNAANEIVGDMGVPASYLNIVENQGNRATLTAESINWARSIIARQQDLEPCLYGFFHKAYCLIWGVKEANILTNIRITFQIPRIAPMTINTEFIENSSRAIEALAALGLSKEYLKRQYMPYINWDQAEEDSVLLKLKQETGEENAESDPMGGMGMMPTGGGGFSGGGMM
jgi:hypothetical protein